MTVPLDRRLNSLSQLPLNLRTVWAFLSAPGRECDMVEVLREARMAAG